jgi:hypothetical protein
VINKKGIPRNGGAGEELYNNLFGLEKNSDFYYTTKKPRCLERAAFANSVENNFTNRFVFQASDATVAFSKSAHQKPKN